MSADDPDDRGELARRVGASLREIRRGGAMARVRAAVLGWPDSPLELGGSDTLAIVCERGGLRMSELAEALRVDASTATRAVDRLEAAGFVRRESDPADRRVVAVVATPAGLEQQVAVRERYAALMHGVLAGFDDAELATLARLLERLVAGIDGVA